MSPRGHPSRRTKRKKQAAGLSCEGQATGLSRGLPPRASAAPLALGLIKLPATPPAAASTPHRRQDQTPGKAIPEGGSQRPPASFRGPDAEDQGFLSWWSRKPENNQFHLRR